MAKCKILTKSFKSIQSLELKDLFDEVYFINFLKNIKWSKKAQKEIVEIYRLKIRNKKESEKVFNLFLQARDALPVDPIDRVIYYEDRAKKIKKITSFSWKSIFEIDMALERKNLGLAKNIMTKLIAYRSEFGDFDFDHLVKLDEVEKAKKYLRYNFGKIKKTFGNDLLVKMYIRKVLDLMKGKLRSELVNDYSVDWSLSDIRSYVQTEGGQRDFFPFWLELLENRGKDNEIVEFVKAFSVNLQIEDLQPKYFWIFRYALPDNLKLRRVITKKLDTLINSKEAYEKYLGLSVLENDVLKKEMEKISEKYRRPLFQMRRSFYRDQLKQGRYWKYSLFNLVRIGNVESTFFWWNIL